MKTFRSEPKNPWMQTFTGIAVDMVEPTRDMISVVDMAHHLSLECRYAGACRWHYSVAQHSYLMCREVMREGGHVELQLECLLHDGHEAYTKDQHAPLSWATKALTFGADPVLPLLETRFDRLIRSMWQLPMEKSPECHTFDMKMMFTERQQLMTLPPFAWRSEGQYPAFDLKIVQWTPTMAEKTWLLELKRLTALRFKQGKPT